MPHVTLLKKVQNINCQPTSIHVYYTAFAKGPFYPHCREKSGMFNCVSYKHIDLGHKCAQCYRKFRGKMV